MKCTLILFFVFCVIVPFISADILSLNSGGSKEVVINPDSYIEGFFSGVQVLSTCGNGLVETPYEACDDGNYNSNDGCSSLCAIESGYTCSGQPSVCILIHTEPEEGGGGAGGGGGIIPGTNISVTTSWNTNMGINLAVGTTHDETITVTNLGANSVTVTLTHNFSNHLQIWEGNNTLTISPNESKVFNIRFIAGSTPATITGKIWISDQTILTSLDISTLLLLFDSNIIVLNKDYLVPQGDNLKTSVTLIPLGDKVRMDVTLNYFIKDYNGRIYLTRSETVLVENQINFKRNFDTGILPLGSYVVGLELIYPNGVAPSSAHFEVTQGRQNTFFGKVVFFLVNAILLVLILIIILIILRIIKQIKENKKYGEKEKLVKKLTSENNESFKAKEKSEK